MCKTCSTIHWLGGQGQPYSNTEKASTWGWIATFSHISWQIFSFPLSFWCIMNFYHSFSLFVLLVTIKMNSKSCTGFIVSLAVSQTSSWLAWVSLPAIDQWSKKLLVAFTVINASNGVQPGPGSIGLGLFLQREGLSSSNDLHYFLSKKNCSTSASIVTVREYV